MTHTFQVTFDAVDPDALATFWALALGYIPQPPPEGYDTWEVFAKDTGIPEDQWDSMRAVVDPDGIGPRLLFQQVPEASPPRIGCIWMSAPVGAITWSEQGAPPPLKPMSPLCSTPAPVSSNVSIGITNTGW